MSECEHSYQFQGVVYSSGYQLPGSGACVRQYEDRYFCSRCLNIVDKNMRTQGNDYGKPIEGSFTK